MVYHLVLIQLALNWNIHSEYAQVIQVVGMFQPPVVFFLAFLQSQFSLSHSNPSNSP